MDYTAMYHQLADLYIGFGITPQLAYYFALQMVLAIAYAFAA